MVVESALHGDAAAVAAIADEILGRGGVDLQAFFDHAELEAAAGGEGEGEGEGGDKELEWLSNKDAFPAVDTMLPPAPRQKRVRRAGAAAAPTKKTAGRRCRHCGAKKTPQWREGPEGPGTLCNACGMRYRSGRLVPEYRPANSPAFSPQLHSNFHRRIVEMRRKREAAAMAATAAAGKE